MATVPFHFLPAAALEKPIDGVDVAVVLRGQVVGLSARTRANGMLLLSRDPGSFASLYPIIYPLEGPTPSWRNERFQLLISGVDFRGVVAQLSSSRNPRFQNTFFYAGNRARCRLMRHLVRAIAASVILPLGPKYSRAFCIVASAAAI